MLGYTHITGIQSNGGKVRTTGDIIIPFRDPSSSFFFSLGSHVLLQ